MLSSGRFSFQLFLNLADLVVDEGAVRVDTIQTCHVHTCLVDSALTVCVAGRLRKQKDGAAQDDSPKCRQAVRNPPLGAVVVTLGGAIVDHVGGPDTEGDEELVGADSGSTDTLGNGLRLVHRNDRRQCADSETCSEATHRKLYPDRLASNLDDDTNDVEEGGSGNGDSSTVRVCQWCRAQTSEESTNTIVL